MKENTFRWQTDTSLEYLLRTRGGGGITKGVYGSVETGMESSETENRSHTYASRVLRLLLQTGLTSTDRGSIARTTFDLASRPRFGSKCVSPYCHALLRSIVRHAMESRYLCDRVLRRSPDPRRAVVATSARNRAIGISAGEDVTIVELQLCSIIGTRTNQYRTKATCKLPAAFRASAALCTPKRQITTSNPEIWGFAHHLRAA